MEFRYDAGSKVAFSTLGCKLNYSETSYLAAEFERNGYRIVDDTDVADIYIVNTCSVTEHADKKCRNMIRRLHKLNPSAVIAVTGCYAQLKPDEINAIEGVSVVVGTQYKGKVFDIVRNLHKGGDNDYHLNIDSTTTIFPAYSSGERTRSFLKVQDGCDYRCSYCTIPLARGKSRNIPVADLVEEAHEIASKGIREIVLTGVNTGDFGKTTGEDFLDLLKALDEVDGIDRYRISSIEPNLLREDIVEWIASGTRFMPHFHIPLQSGSDSVLKRMRRRYSTELFASRIDMVRKLMEKPGSLKVFFGIDLIAGFPGETDEEFMETYTFLKDMVRPAYIHVFPYSRRPNTPAASFSPQVKDSVKTERVEKLSCLCEDLYRDFKEANRGLESYVLFEQKTDDGMMTGYSENYIKVEKPFVEGMLGRTALVRL